MSRAVALMTKYPLLRGVVSYSIIWPTSAFIQQKIAGKTWGKRLDLLGVTIQIQRGKSRYHFTLIVPFVDEIDWMKCVRFSVYGGLYVAPTLYTWIRVSSKVFPKNNLRSAVSKV